jgi:hypothetical protein
MSGSRRAVLVVLCAVLVGTSFVPPAEGRSFGRAGVAVVHGDGSVRTDCVKLERRTISGFQLLRQSKFHYKVAQFSFGKALCYLDGEGVKTTDPDECFSDPDGEFWGYWVQDKDNTAPAESGVGASDRNVRRGSIDYWVWDTFPQTPPAALTLADICRA